MEQKFKIEIELETHNSNDAKIKILAPDGSVIDPEPWFTEIDISLRQDEPVYLKAKMYGDHLSLKAGAIVGTLSSFKTAELHDELQRRHFGTNP